MIPMNIKMDPAEISEMRVSSFFRTRSQLTISRAPFSSKWTRRDFPTGPFNVTPVFEPEASAFHVADAINSLDLRHARAALCH